ncbi:MAG: 2Fe-2S iron-sulfur cluster-binding protein [Desulfobacterota bacterium]|nr:2Fe-2S iron-sulfur cluster-binding protein [Thermodesulfobacteriota bacterium]MDW8001647.1 2Fe-2S iron-sulfur cluster-binding protein [Deltaproteobacteria bacterium]
MSDVKIVIDGREVKAEKGTTILDVAFKEGIEIPTLCYRKDLEPYGGCRLCTVEIETKGRITYVVSCLYPVEEGLIVRTRTPQVEKIRKIIVELLLARAPEAPELKKLKEEYQAEDGKFPKEPVFCILCGLCVRYCAEIKKKYAITFMESGLKREVRFIPEVASKECARCKECFPLCPTSYLQALYLLTSIFSSESLTQVVKG